MRHTWIKLFLIVVLLAQVSVVHAQDQNPNQPVYIVQSGDTLTGIAGQFNVSVTDLIAANNLVDPNNLQAGQQLVIPGLEGVSGVLSTETIPFGVTLADLSRQYQVPQAMLIRLNRLTSPAQLYAGSSLIIPQQEQSKTLSGRAQEAPGQTLLEVAAENGLDPWSLVDINDLQGTWDALPGETLYYPSDATPAASNSIAVSVSSVDIQPLPLVQGGTTEINIKTNQPVNLSGSLAGHELHFFQNASNNQYVALQGINALADPGLYPLTIKGVQADGKSFDVQQMVVVADGNYPKDPPLSVPPETLDPAANKAELDLLQSKTATVDPQRKWNGIFQTPVDQPVCIKSWFGDRRSYNGGPYDSFHGGVDFGVCANLNIYAAAPGVVVYTGMLTARGNTTIIDNGWGIYTLYCHQSAFGVKAGDVVQKGQLIGQIGATGRVNGPHLHFEVWVNGEEVNPLDWLQRAYP
jgi:murein DD-endopeptidase MepM/ murein hydrolase activator NlpD